MHRFVEAASRSCALAFAAALLVAIGIVAPGAPADAQTAADTLRPGRSLASDARLVSEHGRSVLEVARSGALIRRTSGAARWTSGTTTTTAKASGTSLHFERSGRLVLTRRGGHVAWRSTRVRGATRVSLTDDGALTLVAPGRTVQIIPAATSRTGAVTPAPVVVPDPTLSSPAQLVPEQQLRAGERLMSQNGRFRLTMQHDGNLVLDGPSGPLWTSKTAVGDDATTTMQPDGNLVVHDATGQPKWATRTAVAGSYLVLQDDGDLVVYSPDGRAVWASKTGARS